MPGRPSNGIGIANKSNQTTYHAPTLEADDALSLGFGKNLPRGVFWLNQGDGQFTRLDQPLRPSGDSAAALGYIRLKYADPLESRSFDETRIDRRVGLHNRLGLAR